VAGPSLHIRFCPRLRTMGGSKTFARCSRVSTSVMTSASQAALAC